MKFAVTIERILQKTFLVDADNETEARRMALDTAENVDFEDDCNPDEIINVEKMA